jgi:hypothetical protein
MSDLSKIYIQGPETAEQNFSVIVDSPGWHGHFTIPQSCFDELTTFLARHATAEKTA